MLVRRARLYTERRFRIPRAPRSVELPKRTYQPKRIPRRRRHGFLHRMATAAGRRVIRARRGKGRKRLVTV